MAPKFNVVSIRKDTFFKKEQCPMRSGGTRCPCICSVARAGSKDHADLKVATKWRQNVLNKFERIESTGLRPSDDSAEWAELALTVRKVMGWALCRKHQAQLDLAVLTTMDSLKEACGPAVQGNSTQLHPGGNAVNDQPAPPAVSATSFTPSAHNQAPPNVVCTPSHLPTVSNNTSLHDDYLDTTHASQVNAHGALQNTSPPGSHSSRPRPTAHLASPPPSPATTAVYPTLPPIIINNNNRNIIYAHPATAQQLRTLQSTPISGRHAADAQTTLQPRVEPEVDCKLTMSQAPDEFTPSRPVAEEQARSRSTGPGAPNPSNVRPRTDSDYSCAHVAQQQPLKEGLRTSITHADLPDDTDWQSLHQKLQKSEKENQTLILRNMYLQRDHERPKVKFHTSDDRFTAAESTNQELETQLRIATEQIGQLTLENLELRTRNHATLEDEDFEL